MHIKTNKILAIDPGTKELGVAVLEGEELLYYGVKTIRKRARPQQVLLETTRIINSLIADYRPAVLAIEKMFLIQKSASLLVVAAEEIKAAAREKGLEVFEYSPTFVRKFVCDSGKATKREVAQVIVRRYPVLSRYLNRQSKWEQIYWANMFDAIAVGLTCLQRLSLKSPDNS